MPLVPGQAVEALWPEDGEWYNAVVRAVTNKGIELDYEDGDFRADATEDEIRVKEPVEEESSMADLLDGILDAPDPEPEPGIEVSNEMAHLDAELDDGLGDLLDGIIDDEEEAAVAPEEPTVAPEEPAAAEPVVAAPGEVAAAIADAYREDFHLEKDVEAEDVVDAFSTNDKAASVLQAAVRGRSARKEKPSLAVGACVEARFGGDDEWFPGKVDGVNEDGTYAIAYDDGDREENVQPALVRAVVPDAPDAPDEPGVDGGATASPPSEPAEPEPEPEPTTEEDATDGVFNLTAIHERKELPAPRRLDMNANAGEGEKPLRKQQAEKRKPRPRPFSAGAVRENKSPTKKVKRKKRRPRSAAAMRNRASDASYIEGIVASTPSQLGYGSRLWDGVRRWIDEREAEQAARREAEDAAPPPPSPPKRRRRPRTAGARPRTSNADAVRHATDAIYKSPPRILEARPPPPLIAGAPAPAPAKRRSPERRPAPMPPGHLMNGVMLKLRKPPRRRARDIEALERGFTLRI
jgi:hypothetical protein